MEITLTDEKIKNLLKTAVIEALDERREFIRELIEEIIEDVALSRAIEAGIKTELIERETVFRLLDEKP